MITVSWVCSLLDLAMPPPLVHRKHCRCGGNKRFDVTATAGLPSFVYSTTELLADSPLFRVVFPTSDPFPPIGRTLISPVARDFPSSPLLPSTHGVHAERSAGRPRGVASLSWLALCTPHRHAVFYVCGFSERPA